MERIENILKNIPTISLIPYETPLYKVDNILCNQDTNIYIKRDDLTGVGPGGNKVRNLEFILADAIKKNCTKILVSGPLQSNLCTITASACSKLGIDCELIFNGEEALNKQGNQLLNEILGVKCHYLGKCSSKERNKFVNILKEKYDREGWNSYIIENGGTSGIGALGYVKLVYEMKKQCEESDVKDMTIFIPGGNGGIAAGMIYGNELVNSFFDLVVISVEDEYEVLIKHIKKTISEIEKITDFKIPNRIEKYSKVIDDYRGEGWGKNTIESRKMIFQFARESGIFIENIYNSKTVVGMFDFIQRGLVNENVCFLHTGGFASLFSQFN